MPEYRRPLHWSNWSTLKQLRTKSALHSGTPCTHGVPTPNSAGAAGRAGGPAVATRREPPEAAEHRRRLLPATAKATPGRTPARPAAEAAGEEKTHTAAAAERASGHPRGKARDRARRQRNPPVHREARPAACVLMVARVLAG